MEKNILFIGDSITEGNTGESYLEIISRKLEDTDYKIHNHGLGGDTLEGVKTRLIDLFSRGERYDIVVIEVGHNDIVLPYLEENDPTWKRGVQMLKEEGLIPEPSEEGFETKLKNTLQFLKDNHGGEVIMTTLSCLGEDLNSDLNHKRKAFNEIIKKQVEAFGYKVADVGEAFDNILQEKQAEVIKKELVSTFLNPPSTGLVGDTTGTFFLTLDGVHINKQGARIYAEVILSKLLL